MPERRSVRETIFSAMQDNLIPVAIVVGVLFLIIPLTKTMIDIAMVLNLALSFIILLTVLYMKRAADFSSFPRVILLDTMFGLAINISSTRNILFHPVTRAGVHMDGQSEMVQAFANIVAGSDLVVGFIMFVILIVVQMLVVTKGAERVSEVSARFTLDAMNNKKFDIQNDLNAGVITDEEAKRRKALLDQEIGFYSAMDGASKFVSGNVKAGIFITVVNLIGGIVTGMWRGNLSFMDALQTYSMLTIGDGLMSQVPSLVLTFSTGLLVTGGNLEESLTDQLKKQFSVDGTIYIIVGAVLAVMGVAFHNLSSIVLILIGAFLIYFGVRIKATNKANQEKLQHAEEDAKNQGQKKSGPDEISPIVTPEPLSLDLGYALIPLVDQEKGGELLERVKRVRMESALEMGPVIPPVRIRDNISLNPEEYSFKIRGIEVGRSQLKLGHYMCLNVGGVAKGNELPGEPTKDPSFGMDAIWVPESKRQEAEQVGYVVIDPPTIIATHLTEIIKKNISKLITREEVSSIIKTVEKDNPVIVNEVLNGENKVPYGIIERILKNLLEEQVSITNMVEILETIANFAPITKDPYMLTEKVREALGMQICLQYVDDSRVLHVLRLSQELAQKILDHAVHVQGQKPSVAFDPVDGRKYIGAVSDAVAAANQRGMMPIIVCPPQVRAMVKSSTELEMPGLVVLSYSEVMAAGGKIKIEEIGEING